MELTLASLVTRLGTSQANMLAHDFPNTWNGSGPSQGHSYQSWELRSAVLSHISWLMALTKQQKMKPSKSNIWAELIFRAGT